MPEELFTEQWNSVALQGDFLYQVLRLDKQEAFFSSDYYEKKSLVQLQHASGTIIDQVQELGQLWSNKQIIHHLFESQAYTNEQQRIEELFAKALKTSFDGVFYMLIQLSQSHQSSLLDRLLFSCVKELLSVTAALTDLVESFYKINSSKFIQMMAKVCESEKAQLYLSKILDYAQTIKDFFQPLTQSTYHYFSISLALLAVKRDFLRLENWVQARLNAEGGVWIETFLRYVKRHLLDELEALSASRHGALQQAEIDEVFEKIQLNKNSIAIIFETFLLSDNVLSTSESGLQVLIQEFYNKILHFLPELKSVCITDTEQQATTLLEDMYFARISVDEFIEKVLGFKRSNSNRDSEVLSCIIINIIDEFRFYHNFPEKELFLTSQIFGKFINKQIVEGRAQKILLKALSDSLEKEGKMFKFAIQAISYFIFNLELDIHHQFYQVLFANERVLKHHVTLLHQLIGKLSQHQKLGIIPKESITAVQKIVHEQQRPGFKPLDSPDSEMERESVKKVQIREKSLIEYLNKIFLEQESIHQLSKADKEDVVFWFNSQDERMFERKSFKELVRGREDWIANYLVYQRIPGEPNMQNSYKKLIFRSHVKGLHHKVYKVSMRMINQVLDYVSSKETLLPEERSTSRFCGKWVGFITLVCNQPILLRDLDIKAKIYEAIQKRTISNIIPIICSLLTTADKSTFFTTKVPFVQALLDILREVKCISGMHQTTKIFIEVLFNELKVSEKELKPFHYLHHKRQGAQLHRQQNIFYINTLPSYVKVDKSGIGVEELREKSHVKLEQIVALAIDLSIKDIIEPVKDRSVKNTLETTRELVKKDLAGEPSSTVFLQTAKMIITNLTWNLALVTCREPLRVQLNEHLEQLLSIQTDFDVERRRFLRENLCVQNLDLACQFVQKIVIENALEEIQKDPVIQSEIQHRKLSDQNFPGKYYKRLQREMPAELRPDMQQDRVSEIEIYTKFQKKNTFFLQNLIATPPVEDPLPHNETKIMSLIKKLVDDIEKPNSEEKIKILKGIFTELRNLKLKNKLELTQLNYYAQQILQWLFYEPYNQEKIVRFSDVLTIFCNLSTQLTSYITQWIFKKEKDDRRYQPQLLTQFLKRNLVSFKNFDTLYAKNLSAENIPAITCIVQILKSLVIQDKIFSVHSFPHIVQALVQLEADTALKAQLSQDCTIFLQNLREYLSNEEKNKSKFRLTLLEPEYKKLLQDVKQYFQVFIPRYYKQVCDFLRQWLLADSQEGISAIIRQLERDVLVQDERSLVIFFCYLFEIVVNHSLRTQKQVDYSRIDAVSKLIVLLLVSTEAKAPYYLNKIFTSLIIVLTKKHYCDANVNFNQKPFFRILFNILFDLNRQEYDFKEHLEQFSKIFVQTLHILQPVKYPSFAFAWLQLISSKFLIRSLLKSEKQELWSSYTMLLLDLLFFYNSVFNPGLFVQDEIKEYYMATLKIFLLLLNDFSDFLSQQSFIILEEIPKNFKQFRNLILSAYPKHLKIPNPFKHSNQTIQLAAEYKKIPYTNPNINNRINSHNLSTNLFNYIRNKHKQTLNNIVSSFYILGY